MMTKDQHDPCVRLIHTFKKYSIFLSYCFNLIHLSAGYFPASSKLVESIYFHLACQYRQNHHCYHYSSVQTLPCDFEKIGAAIAIRNQNICFVHGLCIVVCNHRHRHHSCSVMTLGLKKQGNLLEIGDRDGVLGLVSDSPKSIWPSGRQYKSVKFRMLSWLKVKIILQSHKTFYEIYLDVIR